MATNVSKHASIASANALIRHIYNSLSININLFCCVSVCQFVRISNWKYIMKSIETSLLKQTAISWLEGVFLNWSYIFGIELVFLNPFDAKLLASFGDVCQFHSVMISKYKQNMFANTVRTQINQFQAKILNTKIDQHK